jgi:protein TonB
MPSQLYFDSDESAWSRWFLPAAVAASLLTHGVIFKGLELATVQKKAPVRVEVDFVKPPPPPPPPPPEKKVEPAKPKFLPPKLVKTPPKPPPPLPASNQSKPIDPPKEPPKPVFGVTKDSVVEGGEGISAPVGNTLMKEPDKEFTPPEEVKPYYQPEKAPFVPAKLVEVTEFPREKDRVIPDYPPDLRAQGVEGTVLIEVDIDETGKVVDARLKRPTGLAFDEAALKAIRASSYHPARRGSEAVSIRVTIPVKFRLR